MDKLVIIIIFYFYYFFFGLKMYIKNVDFQLQSFRVSISWFPSDSSFLSEKIVKSSMARGLSSRQFVSLQSLSAAK